MTESQSHFQMHWLAEVPIMVVEMVLLWWTMLPVLGDIGWSLNWQTVLSIPTLLTAHTARMLESTVILNVRDKYYIIYCQQYTTLYTINSILYYVLSTVYYIIYYQQYTTLYCQQYTILCTVNSILYMYCQQYTILCTVNSILYMYCQQYTILYAINSILY